MGSMPKSSSVNGDQPVKLVAAPTERENVQLDHALASFTLPMAALAVLVLTLALVSLVGTYYPMYAGLASQVQLGLLAAVTVLIGVVSYRLRRQFLIPLTHLREWSQRIRAGDLYTPIPEPEDSGFRDIIRDINNLSDELDSLTEEMDLKVRAQTEHIAAKSRSLEILYDIATDLSVARNLDELLEQFLDTLMVLVDARAATVRMKTDDGHTRLVASRGLAPEIIRQEQSVALDRCLCGTIAREGGLGIQKGVATCNKFLDGTMLDGHCSELIVVPLQYRDRILGIYNLFLGRPSAELGKDVRDLLNSIGKHLGLAVEKARLDNNERRLAVMEERNMIGNELHDSLAQSLVSMRLQVKMLGELLHQKDIRGAQNEVRRLKSAVEEAHGSLRELLANFRSRMDERGLIPAIDDLVVHFKQDTGISVFLHNEWDEFSFSPTQEVQIFRIIQEAMSNIRKHSNACNVRILLHNNNQCFSVLIEDDGLGMDNETVTTSRPGENIGLSIMRERATRLHGELVIESEPGEGTRVNLSWLATPAVKENNSTTSDERRAGTAH